MFTRQVITQRVGISPNEARRNIRGLLLQKLTGMLSGKCLPLGWVQPDSITVDEVSVGVMNPLSDSADYEVTLSANVLFPSPGLVIPCSVRALTKMGVLCQSVDYPQSMQILVPRDHYVENERYQAMVVGDSIEIKVIAHKFAYGDADIFVLAELLAPIVSEADEPLAPPPEFEPQGGEPMTISFGE